MDEAEKAADVLLRGILTTLRGTHGAHWCRHNIVKPIRRVVQRPESQELVSAIRPDLEQTRAAMESSLIKHCDLCGGCKMARK